MLPLSSAWLGLLVLPINLVLSLQIGPFASFPGLGSMREKPVALGSSGLTVGPLGLGTWSWGNKLLWGYDEANDGELQAAYNAAVDAGVTFFDTGDSYGTGALEGQAEKLLGQFQRDYASSRGAANAAKVCVGTKLATYPWRLTADSMEAALAASLRRLGRPQVEVMQLHWPAATYAPWQEPGLRQGLAQCYNKGLCRAVGASNYGPNTLRSLHADLAKQGVPLATNQVQFSLLSRQPLDSGLLNVCRELNVTPIGYSPLALGLLSGKYTGDPETDAPLLPKGPRGLLFKQILPGLKPLLAEVAAVAAARQKTVPQVAINWVLCQGALPIVGAKTAAQVKDNLGALGWRLTATELGRLDAASRAVPRGATQNIFQTD